MTVAEGPSPRAHRFLGWILGAAVVSALGVGWLVTLLPLNQVAVVLGLAFFTLNLLCVVAFLLRARRSVEERTGWLLLGLGSLLSTGASVVTMLLRPLPIGPDGHDWVFFALQLAAGGFQVAGLTAWPRSAETQGSSFQHLLGSLHFASSVLLLMWLGGLLGGAQGGWSAAYLRSIALAVRLALFGGAVVYFIGLDPRRLRGPLGWFLAAAGLSSLLLILSKPFYGTGPLPEQVSVLIGLPLLSPALFVLGAWFGGSVLPVPGQQAPRLPYGEIATYGPYLLSGAAIAHLVVQRSDPQAWPLLAFIAITGLLLLRQFLLLRDLKVVNQGLEEHVRARTRDLERLQGAVVRTERMNAVATVGAGLAHDLNNLLQVVGTSVELIQDQLEAGERPSDRDLSRIRDASIKAGGLTQRLMAFARREQELIHRPDVPPAEALVALEELLVMLAGKQVRLVFSTLPMLTGARVDPGLLEQVLVNLVSNAKDALGGKGTVHVRLSRGTTDTGQPALFLEVEDDGPGIPPELRERIFEPFFTTKPEGKGTGLGLASVRTLAGQMGGDVCLVEGSLGGACFRIVIPEGA